MLDPAGRTQRCTCGNEAQDEMAAGAHLTRGYLGSRVRFSVLGRWKITDLRILCSFLSPPFFTALAALAALAFESLAAP